MNKRRWPWRILIFCLAFTGLVLSRGTIAGQTATSKQCSVDQSQQAQHFFEDHEGKNEWREFESVGATPEASNDGGTYARLWGGNKGNVLVRTEEPGEDFWIFTDYCFNSKGQLIQLRFELRTAWGWGYRKEGPILRGVLIPRISEFFGTNTETRINRPQQAGDIPEALQPKLYLRKSDLPFFKLLSK